MTSSRYQWNTSASFLMNICLLVPDLLTVKQKQRVDDYETYMVLFHQDRTSFLHQYVTIYAIWIDHYTTDPTRRLALSLVVREPRLKWPKIQKSAGSLYFGIHMEFWSSTTLKKSRQSKATVSDAFQGGNYQKKGPICRLHICVKTPNKMQMKKTF